VTSKFYPASIRITHKPNRKPRFSRTYVSRPELRYLIDNEMLLFLVTARTYKLVQRMFLPLLEMPMRWPKNLCLLRIHSASVASLQGLATSDALRSRINKYVRLGITHSGIQSPRQCGTPNET
jgi:hypothetical protein